MRNAPSLGTIVLLLAISGCTPEASLRETLVVRTTEVETIKQVVGHPQWVQQQVNRIEGAVWTFYPDRTFLFNLPDMPANLYPIKGTYQQSGNKYSFNGTSGYKMSAGSGSAEVSGRMYRAKGSWHIVMTQSDAVIAAAVVYGIGHGSSAASTYEYTVRVAESDD